MTIQEVLDSVLEKEGWPVYTVHPNDRGGPTKGGITLRTLESWRGRRCTRAELQRLKKDEALAILNRRYVEINGIHKVMDMTIKSQLIDDAVLSGPLLAVKDFQLALGTVTVDGIIGPQTLAAIEKEDIRPLSNRLAIQRTLRLARFTQGNIDQLPFLVGWVTRSLSFVS